MGGVVVLAQTYLLTGPYEEILWERTFKYRGHWPPCGTPVKDTVASVLPQAHLSVKICTI